MRIKTGTHISRREREKERKKFYSRVTRLPVLSEGRRSRRGWRQTVELGTVFEKRLGGLVSRGN